LDKIHLIATSAFGLESVVGRELKKLGYDDQAVENGKVTFSAPISAIPHTNLWLRSSDRVLLKMGEFRAVTFDQLFEKTKALPWEDWIPEDAEFPVDGKSIDSTLFSVPDCQAIVKKAVVERLKQKYKKEWFGETGSKYKIQVALLKDMATLTIDTSGVGLHKRGYRKLTGGAPLKETMASAMLQISHWKWDRILIDPLCGSGTIPIEAALIGLNIAPGLKRTFDAENWPVISKKLWQNCRTEAMDLIEKNRELRIHGSDIDEEAISLARYHAKQAGVETKIHLQRMDVKDLRSRYKYGIIISNPPYGERLGEKSDLDVLYKQMGQTFSALDSWSYYILTSHPDFEKIFGKMSDKKRKLYNGRILCNYYQFFGPPPKRVLGEIIE
jgi:putative N6-adenine-specific DNA methylase